MSPGPGRIPFFAVTSGTTSGTSKYIPVTAAMRRSNVQAPRLDVLAFHAPRQAEQPLLRRPDLHARRLDRAGEGGRRASSPAISPPSPQDAAALGRGLTPFPPNDLALLTRLGREARRARRRPRSTSDIRALTGTPSWVLILLERVRALRDARGETGGPLYPDARLFIHGGVNFAPYRERFEALFAGQDIDLREVYPASEGFIAIADRGPGEGLRLNLDNGLFFEFVPVDELDSPNPTRHWAATIQPDVNYAVVLTTCAGLFGPTSSATRCASSTLRRRASSSPAAPPTCSRPSASI